MRRFAGPTSPVSYTHLDVYKRQLFQYLQENRTVCLCALHSLSREHLKRFFQTDIHAIIQSTIQRIVIALNYHASDDEVDLLTKFYVGALASMIEEWLLGEIQGTPAELIRFTDQLLNCLLYTSRCV